MIIKCPNCKKEHILPISRSIRAIEFTCDCLLAHFNSEFGGWVKLDTSYLSIYRPNSQVDSKTKTWTNFSYKKIPRCKNGA